MSNSSNPVAFTATLFQAPGRNATGIVVPGEVIARLDAGKRPAVRVSVNGYEYRTTVGVMSGEYLIPVSAAHRTAAGLASGDTVQVELVVDTNARTVDVPADLAEALNSNPAAGTFFDGLSNSLQRYHVDNINGAKSDDTRQRRVTTAIELFLAGKQR